MYTILKALTSLLTIGKYNTTVEFHAFEIHILNADIGCWKIYPFSLDEINILNAVSRDRDDA